MASVRAPKTRPWPAERRDDRRAHAEHAREREQLLVGRLLLRRARRGRRWISCERPVLRAAETPLDACALTGRRACSRCARRAVSGSACATPTVRISPWSSMSIVHQSARRGTASSTSSVSVCCRSSVSVSTTLASARNASACSRWRCSVRSKSVATAATISPPASRTGSALSETMPREPSPRMTSISLSEVDSPASARWMSSACGPEIERSEAPGPSSSCARWFVNSSLRDDVSAMITPSGSWRISARQPFALAVRLLVQRAVVEREPDAARDLLRELRPVVVRRRAALPAEGERAERAPAHDHGHREHRADADASARRAGAPGCDRRCPGAPRSTARPAGGPCGSRRPRACRSPGRADSAPSRARPPAPPDPR